MTEKTTSIIPTCDFDAYPGGVLVKFVKGQKSEPVSITWVKEAELQAKGLIEPLGKPAAKSADTAE